jgi:hypothetical protein
MVERKTKRAEKETEKKVTKVTKGISSSKIEKVSENKKRISKKPTSKTYSSEHKEEKVSIWVLLLFFFSLALLLFSIYKVFIY